MCCAAVLVADADVDDVDCSVSVAPKGGSLVLAGSSAVRYDEMDLS